MNTALIAELLEPFLVTPIVIHDASTIAGDRRADSGYSEGLRTGRESAFLSPSQLQDISTYIDILCRWNARINLTAIRDPEEIVRRHFGESLFAARNLFPGGRSVGEGAIGGAATVAGESDGGVAAGRAAHRGAAGGGPRDGEARRPTDGGTAYGGDASGRPRDEGTAPAGATAVRAVLEGRIAEHGETKALAPEAIRVADIGSGAGFPGFPLKLWAPQLSLTLIESNHKKAAFLREITRALTLTDVNIQNSRAESLGTAVFDVVTLRAVERFEAILPIAAALVVRAGRLALLIGSAQQDQARSSVPTFTWSDPVPIPGSRTRILLIAHRETTNQAR